MQQRILSGSMVDIMSPHTQKPALDFLQNDRKVEAKACRDQPATRRSRSRGHTKTTMPLPTAPLNQVASAGFQEGPDLSTA